MSYKSEIIVSEGRRPFWHTLIAGFCYTVAIGLLLFDVYLAVNAHNFKAAKGCISTFKLAAIITAAGVRFSVIKTVYFDPAEKIYKKEYSVGPIHTGKWKALPEIEYVSVFKQDLSNGGEIFNVNIWCAANKHIVVYDNVELQPSFEMAKFLAKKLNVDFLDASDPHNKKWFEFTDADKLAVLQAEEEHHVC